MIPWKHRIYAFLLRRVLGPILDNDSLRQLHSLLDVSIRDGRCTLKHVTFRTDFLREKLVTLPFAVRNARVRELTVHITFQEDNTESAKSTTAWKTLELASEWSKALPHVSLAVKLELDGIVIELEPQTPVTTCPTTTSATTTTTADPSCDNSESTQERTLLSLYLDAALQSLDLAAEIKDLTVRCWNKEMDQQTKQAWVEVRCHSLSYKTVPCIASSEANIKYETKLHKFITFHQVTVIVGESGHDPDEYQPYRSSIALLEGVNRISLRIIEYNDDTTSTIPTKEDSATRTETDIEATFSQKLNLMVDTASLLILRKITESYSSNFVVNDHEQEMEHQVNTVRESDSEVDDLDFLNMMMEQYREARQHVERNELRGGVLVPDFPEDQNNGAVTFDMFFDAMDKSFYQYSTLLHESIMSPNNTSHHAHARIRLHIKQIELKVVFAHDQTLATLRNESYMLTTVEDIDFSSTLFAHTQEQSLTIGRFEIEDTFISTPTKLSSLPRTVVINPVLSFLYDSEPNIESNDDMLLQPPSMSLNFRKSTNDVLDIDIQLLPVIYNVRLKTLTNVSSFLAGIQQSQHSDPLESQDETVPTKTKHGITTRISFFCPSVRFALPVMIEEDFPKIFERSSYLFVSPGTNTTHIGIDFENILIDINRKETLLDEYFSCSCDNAVAFAYIPSGGEHIDRIGRRFDIFALVGRAEVLPTTSISIKVWQECLEIGEPNSPSRGEMEFPVVNPISSFKARQEDEDDNARIDRILCSELAGVDTFSRKQFKQTDNQQEMTRNAAKSDTVVVFCIPEVIGDVTSSELSMILLMMQSISKQERSLEESSKETKHKGYHSTSLLVNLTSISLTLHEDAIAEKRTSRSFTINGHGLKIHGVVHGSSVIQGRVLLQDVHFFEVENMAMQSFDVLVASLQNKVRLLKKRVAPTQPSLTKPIFYRSKLFKPISPTSPCFLLDFSIPERVDNRDDLMEMHVQTTFYDITMRFDYESRQWPVHLMALFPSTTKTSQDVDSTLSSTFLARSRISFADCNVDYSSPPRFNTPSRTIVRFGDLRFSSNFVLPKGSSQAFSVTLGDLSIYLCNNRFPYNFENSNLIGSPIVFQPWQISLDFLRLLSQDGISSDDIQRKMNFRTLITLDSLEAVLSLSHKTPRNPTDASMNMSLSVGELAIYCCKDSFSIFLGTIRDLSSEMGAIDDAALQALKNLSTSREGDEAFFDSMTDEIMDGDNNIESNKKSVPTLDNLRQQSAIRSYVANDSRIDQSKDFLLDGYDWTTIDMDEVSNDIPAGEEQSARWFRTSENVRFDEKESNTDEGKTGLYNSSHSTKMNLPPIISHHFPLQPVSNPLGDGDMGAFKYSGNCSSRQVKNRLLLHDFTLKVRCFDGYDWPEMLSETERRSAQSVPFVIDNVRQNESQEKRQETSEEKSTALIDEDKLEKKAKLIGALLDDKDTSATSLFSNLPLPEDRNKKLQDQSEIRRLSRRTSKYIQFSASGIQIRLDTFEESKAHRLASCMDMKIHDFFVAETISKDRPTKMVGEWVNDQEHPRNTGDGLVAVKMVTWHGVVRVTPDNEIVSDEAQIAAKFLPLRCSLDQRAIRFAIAFFTVTDDGDSNDPLPEGLHAVPPTVFKSFLVCPLKIKVDYNPEKIDTAALKNGAVVELVNLSPLDGMVVTLQDVVIKNEVGFGSNIGILVRQWIQDVCATQLHKFVTHAAPFQPITHVGRGAFDLVVLPWEALQNGESIQKAIRAGTTSFTNALSYEAFTLSSRITEVFASSVASLTNSRRVVQSFGGFSSTLPSRPIRVPRTLNDASQHALESLSRGLQAANYRIVIVPYREYNRTGAAGAGSSFVTGIPVAIAAPASGVAEALSFSLLAIRNQLRPDILREEEASLRGLLFEDDRKDSNRH